MKLTETETQQNIGENIALFFLVLGKRSLCLLAF